MKDATSVLFDLPGFVVIECVEHDDGDGRRVVIMQLAIEHGCPDCGIVVCGKPYDLRDSAVKDLPFGERRLVVIWRKRATAAPSRPAIGSCSWNAVIRSCSGVARPSVCAASWPSPMPSAAPTRGSRRSTGRTWRRTALQGIQKVCPTVSTTRRRYSTAYLSASWRRSMVVWSSHRRYSSTVARSD